MSDMQIDTASDAFVRKSDAPRSQALIADCVGIDRQPRQHARGVCGVLLVDAFAAVCQKAEKVLVRYKV